MKKGRVSRKPKTPGTAETLRDIPTADYRSVMREDRKGSVRVAYELRTGTSTRNSCGAARATIDTF